MPYLDYSDSLNTQLQINKRLKEIKDDKKKRTDAIKHEKQMKEQQWYQNLRQEDDNRHVV